MLNKELLLTSSLNSSIQLPFISGSGVDPYCYIIFRNDSSSSAIYTYKDSGSTLTLPPGDRQSSWPTSVPDTFAITVINTLLGRNAVPNNMYIGGALFIDPSNGQTKVNVISPSDGGFTWGAVYLGRLLQQDKYFQTYLIGILSGQYQPVEGVVDMYIIIT